MFNIEAKSNVIEQSRWAKFRGGEFLIAPTTNLGFQRTVNRLQAPHRKKIEKGTLDPQVSLEITCQAVAHNLIQDWRGLVDNSGANVPFSKEVAVQLLTNMPDLREFVQEFALDLENFRAEETEEMGKK
jgi:hypothetical protein